LPPTVTGIVIEGPPHCGKTSVALQLAVSAATFGRCSVALFAEEQSLHRKGSRPVVTPFDTLPDHVLARLEFCFVHSLADVRRSLVDTVLESEGNTAQRSPMVVIVDDDFSNCVTATTDAAAATLNVAKTLASLDSTVRSLRAMSQQQAQTCAEAVPPFFVFVTNSIINNRGQLPLLSVPDVAVAHVNGLDSAVVFRSRHGDVVVPSPSHHNHH